MVFAATWIQLEIIILGKSEKDKCHVCHLYAESKIRYKGTCFQSKNRLADIENKPEGKGKKRDSRNLGLTEFSLQHKVLHSVSCNKP